MPDPLPLPELAQKIVKGPQHTTIIPMETKHNTTDSFQVVKLSEKHTFSNTQLRPRHRHANKKVLGHFLKGILADSTAWNDKIYALNLLRRTPEESFLRLPIYCYNLQKKNLGMVTHIETNDDNKFEYFFMTTGCVVQAFQRCLRPIIIINGAHLKGKYLGIIVGMDGNNQILPVAFGVGKTKSEESWIWFLSRLKECIGDIPSLAIISDKRTKILFCEATKAYRESDFKESLSRLLRALNDDC
uniref:MULE transposase domain-containing protein n=1 Tax=Lactuca sativa TaxID=4236 RepID=A0A9R1X527_LACSA|nr:hypothetical protein LSAT_V11C600330620 [Lactuca sativa]